MAKKRESICCVCGSEKMAVGILCHNRPVTLAAFPNLKPRKRFPLCSPCRRKIKWVEIESPPLASTPPWA